MNRLTTIAMSGVLMMGAVACGSSSGGDSGGASAAAKDPKACADGKTLTKGTLTIATGEPAFPPYVIDDTKPESGEGFEAAVAMAVAREMGFDAATVKWVRTGFDDAIAPGPKDFDFNLQQYTINAERAKAVSFSDPYYTAAQAVVGLADSPAAASGDIKAMKLGVAAKTTSLTYVNDTIKPAVAAQVYDDNSAAVQALQSNQIDGIVADLPTAIYLANVELTGAKLFGQIEGSGSDQFGLLLAKDSALVGCVNGALANLTKSGELTTITTKWMSDFSAAPVIKLG